MGPDNHVLTTAVKSNELLSFIKHQDQKFNRIYLRNIPAIIPIQDVINDNSIFDPGTTSSCMEAKRKNGVVGTTMVGNKPSIDRPYDCSCVNPESIHTCDFYTGLDDSFVILNPGFKDDFVPETETDAILASPSNDREECPPDYLFVPIESNSSLPENSLLSPDDSAKSLSVSGFIPKSRSTDFSWNDYDNFENDLIFPYQKSLEKNVLKNEGAKEAPFILHTPKRRQPASSIPQCKSDHQIFQSTQLKILEESPHASSSKYILPIPDGSEISSNASSSRAGSIYELSRGTSKSSSIHGGNSVSDLRLDNFHQSEYLQFKSSQNSLDLPPHGMPLGSLRPPPLEQRSFSLPQQSGKHGNTLLGNPSRSVDIHNDVSHCVYGLSSKESPSIGKTEFPRYFTPLIISEDSDGNHGETASGEHPCAGGDPGILSDKKSIAYGRKKSLLERRKLLRESRQNTGSSSGSFSSSFEGPSDPISRLKSSLSDCRMNTTLASQICDRQRKTSLQSLKSRIPSQDSMEEKTKEPLQTLASRRQVFAKCKSKKSIEPEDFWENPIPTGQMGQVGQYVRLGSSSRPWIVRSDSDSSSSSDSSTDSSSSSSTSSSSSSSDSSDY